MLLVPKELDDALNRARALFREVQSHHPEWERPPFDPRRYAEMLEIPIAPFRQEAQWDALLLPGPSGFRILYNTHARSAARQRFSIAHEIAHTLFPDSEMGVQRRAQREEYETAEEIELERWCDQVAAELLMPASIFRTVKSELGDEANAVPALADAFQVSGTAAAIRFVELSEEPCAVAFFEWMYRPSVESLPRGSQGEIGEGRKYRVRSIHCSSKFPRILAVGKSVPNRSAVYRCSLGTKTVIGKETFVQGRRTHHHLRVSAFPMHREGKMDGPPRVCAVFRSAVTG